MKKHTVFKTAQLVIFVILAAAVIALVFSNPTVYHQAAVDSATRLLCIGLWATLGLSFLFLFLDFYFFLSYRKDYKEMDYALHSDPLSGIANRFSCDMVVEKYLDKPLPTDLASIMIDLSNIRQINQLYGHLRGNTAITDFSTILNAASEGLCFVGRNGGNKFLALFEDATEQKMTLFLDRVKEKVDSYNANSNNSSIQYRYGIAFHEEADINEITKLIALSNARIYSTEETVQH